MTRLGLAIQADQVHQTQHKGYHLAPLHVGKVKSKPGSSCDCMTISMVGSTNYVVDSTIPHNYDKQFENPLVIVVPLNLR